jgi:hypothetical protein
VPIENWIIGCNKLDRFFLKRLKEANVNELAESLDVHNACSTEAMSALLFAA